MNSSKWVSVFVLFLFAFVTLVWCSDDVVVLTESNFDANTAEGVWMVEYYAPWCGHCKKLAPTWAEFATAAKGEVHVGKVDCTEEEGLCSRFGVRGYPTIKLIRDNKLYDYNQAREVAQFTSFATEGYKTATPKELPKKANKEDKPKEKKKAEGKKEPEPAAAASQVVVLTASDFESQVREGNWLVEFYAPWCGHCKKLAPTWESLATKTEGKFKVAKVDCTVEKDVCTQKGVRGYPTIKFFKGGEVYDYKGPRTEEAFIKFATGGYAPQEEAAPVKKEGAAQPASDGQVVVLTTADFAQKTAQGVWLVEFYAPWCGHCKRLAPTWEELAGKAEGFHVAKVDCTVEKDIATKFAVSGYPTIKLLKDNQVYEYKGARTVEAFTEFVKTGYATAPKKPSPFSTSKHDEL